jgi:glucose-1-phosphate cytidylyltransferase
MNIFAVQGFKDFVIACGYKGEVINDWVEEQSKDLDWNIKALDTGIDTQTGGRIKKCMEFIGNEKVLATYGDGLANVSITELLNFHDQHKKKATLTAVRPPARFGYLELRGTSVVHFGEKNQSDVGWINGGFFVLNPDVSNYIESYIEPFETGALPKLAALVELEAFQHSGFWQPMDTLREKMDLEKLSKLTIPPWLNLNKTEISK